VRGSESKATKVGTVVPIRKRLSSSPPPQTSHEREEAEDATLVLRALDGDRGAEGELVGRHAREVARVIARVLGSHDDVEDIAQDVFLAAFESLERLAQPAFFRGWLLRIAVNKARMVIRKRKLLRLLGLYQPTPDATLEVIACDELGAEARVELREIDEALSDLPTEQRIAWVMHHVEGHTIRDVSRLCSCSVATTKRRLAAAHRSVLARVDEEVLSDGR
jgi:RNA polymerase sigma-70 factor, ECF subfamily